MLDKNPGVFILLVILALMGHPFWALFLYVILND